MTDKKEEKLQEIIDLTSDERKVLVERERNRREKFKNDLRVVLGQVEGRRLIWRVLDQAGCFRSSFNQNALAMSLNEGKRDIGLFILDEIFKTLPMAFTQMQREAMSDFKSQKEPDGSDSKAS